MAGLVLDIYVAFFVRWVIMHWRNVGSHGWPTLAGTVVRCHLEKPGFGCTHVVLDYKYKMNFEHYSGCIKKPFINDNYAEAYMRRFPADRELRLHVCPNESARSFPVLD
jgi:hypothetical protein